MAVMRVHISTHSPRVGRTFGFDISAPEDMHFNSLAPCGANPRTLFSRTCCQAFQLTRPVWGEPADLS